MRRMPLFVVKFYEWDCNHGEMIERYEDVIEARSERELKRSLQKRLDSLWRDARRRGWDCEFEGELRMVCYKRYYDEDYEEGYDEDYEYVLCREVGYEYYRKSK